MLIRPGKACSTIGHCSLNGVQASSEHGSDYAMVRAHLRPRLKAADLKAVRLKNFSLALQGWVEDLGLVGGRGL